MTRQWVLVVIMIIVTIFFVLINDMTVATGQWFFCNDNDDYHYYFCSYYYYHLNHMTVATGRWLVVLHGSTTEEPRLPKISPVIDRDGDDDYESMMMAIMRQLLESTDGISICNRETSHPQQANTPI